ncbi:hypothetical protein J6590_051330 [Homalodisca vitripennis]|nr:hypothetical protein J6590_051330 [Homalodisca vitripennis]
MGVIGCGDGKGGTGRRGWREYNVHYKCEVTPRSEFLAALTRHTPLPLIGYFPLPPVYCLAWICLDVLFCTASIMHLCTISVDRYLSLRYPMKFGRNKTRKRVTLKIVFVWLLSIAMSLPLCLMYSQVSGKDGQHGRLQQSGIIGVHYPLHRQVEYKNDSSRYRSTWTNRDENKVPLAVNIGEVTISIDEEQATHQVVLSVSLLPRQVKYKNYNSTYYKSGSLWLQPVSIDLDKSRYRSTWTNRDENKVPLAVNIGEVTISIDEEQATHQVVLSVSLLPRQVKYKNYNSTYYKSGSLWLQPVSIDLDKS